MSVTSNQKQRKARLKTKETMSATASTQMYSQGGNSAARGLLDVQFGGAQSTASTPNNEFQKTRSILSPIRGNTMAQTAEAFSTIQNSMTSPLNASNTYFGGGHLPKSPTQNAQMHLQHSRQQKALRQQMQQQRSTVVTLDTDLPGPKIDNRGLSNPYSFKFTDKFMQKESAPNYYPPVLRRQMADFMTKTSIRLDAPNPVNVFAKANKRGDKGSSKMESSRIKKYAFAPDAGQVKELKKLNRLFDDHFKSPRRQSHQVVRAGSKMSNSSEKHKIFEHQKKLAERFGNLASPASRNEANKEFRMSTKDPKLSKKEAIKGKITANMRSFGEKTYNDPKSLRAGSIGDVDRIPESALQASITRPVGADGPKKQFMKQVKYKNDEQSIMQTSYNKIAEDQLLSQRKEQNKFSLELKKELKKQNFDYGFDPVTDYQTMKKMMQDHGHEGFVKTVSTFMEKRKKKSDNNIFPAPKLSSTVGKTQQGFHIVPAQGYYELYSNGEQDPKVAKKEEQMRIKSIVRKTSPKEQFIMKKHGSQLSVIEEKTKASKQQVGSNIYWLTKGQGIKSPSTLNTDNQVNQMLKQITKRSIDSSHLGLKLQPLLSPSAAGSQLSNVSGTNTTKNSSSMMREFKGLDPFQNNRNSCLLQPIQANIQIKNNSIITLKQDQSKNNSESKDKRAFKHDGVNFKPSQQQYGGPEDVSSKNSRYRSVDPQLRRPMPSEESQKATGALLSYEQLRDHGKMMTAMGRSSTIQNQGRNTNTDYILQLNKQAKQNLKTVKIAAETTASEAQTGGVQIEFMKGHQKAFGQEFENVKQQQHNLIMESGSLEKVNERKNWHLDNNRNFKIFVNMKHKQKYTPMVKAHNNQFQTTTDMIAQSPRGSDNIMLNQMKNQLNQQTIRKISSTVKQFQQKEHYISGNQPTSIVDASREQIQKLENNQGKTQAKMANLGITPDMMKGPQRVKDYKSVKKYMENPHFTIQAATIAGQTGNEIKIIGTGIGTSMSRVSSDSKFLIKNEYILNKASNQQGYVNLGTDRNAFETTQSRLNLGQRSRNHLAMSRSQQLNIPGRSNIRIMTPTAALESPQIGQRIPLNTLSKTHLNFGTGLVSQEGGVRASLDSNLRSRSQLDTTGNARQIAQQIKQQSRMTNVALGVPIQRQQSVGQFSHSQSQHNWNAQRFAGPSAAALQAAGK